MRKFFLRLVVNAIAIAIVAWLLPGIAILNDDIVTLGIVALIFGIINALIKPVVKLLTCPLIIVSLGLFILVINGLMLMLTASLSGGRLIVDGFGSAILGGIIMGIVGIVLESMLGLKDDDDDKRRKRDDRR